METRITARLRDQLGAAKNANEMFRIFSRFNALFVRQRIRGAIREYQTQLIQRVKVGRLFVCLSVCLFVCLFVRQRIRGAIREYQTQLIQRVKVGKLSVCHVCLFSVCLSCLTCLSCLSVVCLSVCQTAYQRCY